MPDEAMPVLFAPQAAADLANARAHRHEQRALETIECRDAILAPDGGEPDWPDADVVIGNPPCLGGNLSEISTA